MTGRSKRSAVVVAVLGLAACNAFPDSLLDAIESADGGGPVGTDSGPGSGDDGGPDAGIDPSDADAAPPLASRYASAVIADGPVAYLRLGETVEAETVAHDEMKTHDGTYSMNGVTKGTKGALAGDADTAVTFTTGAGRITMPAAIDFDGLKSFSVELWFNSDSSNGTIGYLVDHAQYSPSRTGWTVRAGDSTNFERWLNDNGQSSIGMTAPAPGAWHHLVAVWDGTEQSLYLDKVRIGYGGSTVSLPVLGTTFTIGHQNCSCGDNTAFRGAVDEVAIYDKPLSEAAIGRHYDAAH